MIEIPHLDLNVVRHCNMKCVSCSHVSPYAVPWSMTMEMIERDLNVLKPILHPKSVTIVGGEPTIHKQIVDIIRLVKRIRIDDRCMVVTNGKILHKMTEEFWQELEILRLSVYGNISPDTKPLIEKKREQYGFEFEAHDFPEFFQQFDVVPDGSSFYECPWKTDCYTVHDGKFFLCPQSAFFQEVFDDLKMNPNSEKDYLSLDGITEESLRAFMDRKTPLNACTKCRGYGNSQPWREAKSKADFLTASTIDRVVLTE